MDCWISNTLYCCDTAGSEQSLRTRSHLHNDFFPLLPELTPTRLMGFLLAVPGEGKQYTQ